MQNLPGLGVFQYQQVCMQRLPVEGGEGGLTFRAQMTGFGFEMRAIDAVAHQGMADMGKMDPDLVGAAGLELAG